MTIQIDETKLAKLNAMTLGHGSHKTFEEGACAMEAVAWLAGEEHSDAPQCACPVITRAVTRLNDRISDAKLRTELLLPLLPRLIGSRASREVMVKRGYVAADMAVRRSSWLHGARRSRSQGRGGAVARLRRGQGQVKRHEGERRH